MEFKVVIPARFGSTRLPGKPLVKLAGKPMVQHVYKNAIAAGAQSILVATDDDRIVEAVQAFDGCAVMTSAHHRTGTDRIAEVAAKEAWSEDTIVVNLQGDEPLVGPDLIHRAATILENHSEAGVATFATKIDNVGDLISPNTVKVVTDQHGLALYFSRAPIPWVRDAFPADLTQLVSLPTKPTFLRHIGMYAYRVGALRQIANEEPSPLETAESLEQLRALELGISIYVETIDAAPGHGIDTLEDVARCEQRLASSL